MSNETTQAVLDFSDEKRTRQEAAAWLRDSVNLMNQNGTHWIQGHYHYDKDICLLPGDPGFETAIPMVGEDPETGQRYITVAAHCMMGGVQATRSQRIKDAFLKFGAEKLGLRYRRESYALNEMESRYDPVYHATEIALAWASLDHDASKAAHMFSDDNKKSLVAASMLDPEKVEDGDIFEYVADGYDPDDLNSMFHEIVTTTNDDHGTEWSDIVQIHEKAISGLLSGACPITWKAYGELLAKDDSQLKKEAEEVVAQQRQQYREETQQSL